MSTQLSLYMDWNVKKDYTSIGLFRLIKQHFDHKKVLYPGSYVHITPSLVFSDVTYIDSYKDTYTFFEDNDVMNFVVKCKEYDYEPRVQFFQEDYSTTIDVLESVFDIVLSQYAGFVGQATKRYLQVGGILVCNNSHGDASMAFLDDAYELIAVYNRHADDDFSLSFDDLEGYCISTKGPHPTDQNIRNSMKGVVYTKNPSGYIFRKIV